MTTIAINFLHDFYDILYERAVDAQVYAKEAVRDGQADEQHAFAQGRAIAYYEILETFIHQAEAFALDATTIGFHADHAKNLLG